MSVTSDGVYCSVKTTQDIHLLSHHLQVLMQSYKQSVEVVGNVYTLCMLWHLTISSLVLSYSKSNGFPASTFYIECDRQKQSIVSSPSRPQSAVCSEETCSYRVTHTSLCIDFVCNII